MPMLSFLPGSSDITLAKVEHWLTLPLCEQVKWKLSIPSALLIPFWWKWSTNLYYLNLHYFLASKWVCKLSFLLTNTRGGVGERGVLLPVTSFYLFFLPVAVWWRYRFSSPLDPAASTPLGLVNITGLGNWSAASFHGGWVRRSPLVQAHWNLRWGGIEVFLLLFEWGGYCQKRFSVLIGHSFPSLLPAGNRLFFRVVVVFLTVPVFLFILFVCLFNQMLEPSSVSCLGYMGGSKEIKELIVLLFFKCRGP